MSRRNNQIFGLILIILCFNTVAYHQIKGSDSIDKIVNEKSTDSDDTTSFPGYVDSVEPPEDGSIVTNAEIEGEFQTLAFFPGGTGYIYGESRVGETLINDPAGEDPYDRRNIFEWVTYDDIKDDGTLNKEMYWRALSDEPLTWPNSTDWFYMRERNSPHEPSKIYSPVFTEDYEITGRVYWLSWFESNDAPPFSEAINIYYRQNLSLFNPADPSNPTLLASITSLYYEPNIWAGQRTHFADIAETTLIPAGYRLRWDIEIRFSSLPAAGSFLQYTGYLWSGGGSTTWTIDDPDPIYDNTYTINNVIRMSGIQLRMRSKGYPNINVLGATNNTVYQVLQNLTIDVTAGSISSYRWNSGGWTSFSDLTSTTLPNSHGWNYLEIKASDPVFNNTKIVTYIFGYDKSVVNVVLNGPMSNGSTIVGGTIINLSVFSVNKTDYMWDNNGTWFQLESPYDISAPDFDSEHILSIRTQDFYTTETVNYIFIFDSTNPTIQIYNVVNDTTHAPNKVIEFNITDNSAIQTAYYNWDSGTDQLWIPAQGTIYQTNLPIGWGYHELVTKAYDTFGHYTEKFYRFYTDDQLFLLELAEFRSDSYYLGGDDVVINVQKSNGTIRYVWDSGTIKDGSIIAGQMTLTGVDAMPTTAGPHNLTIIVFDLPGTLYIFYFNFIVDLEAPIIDGSIVSLYNDTRFTTDNTMEFIITDNYTNINHLIVYISIDGKANQTLNNPFRLNLYTFNDDTHYFTIYVYDLAGNYAIQTIIFYIDTLAPKIEIDIPSMIVYLDDNYVTTGAQVIVTVDDLDPIVDTFYSWSGAANSSFSGIITLSYGDDASELLIYANDSLGHINVYTIKLIIDNTAPQLILSSPNELDEINRFTDLEFDIDEENIETVNSIGYYWDKLEFYYFNTTYDSYKSITLRIPSLFFDGPGAYVTGYTATLVIELHDILGHSVFGSFDFIIDRDGPIPGLYLNESGVITQLEEGIDYTSLGETPVLYKNDTNDDIATFYYIWDEDDATGGYLDLDGILTDGYVLVDLVPYEDGHHILRIVLTDNTISTQSNSETYIFNIKVNDIDIDILDPNPEEWVEEADYLSYHHRMNFTDTFSFTVNVTDTVDGSEIPSLLNRTISRVYNLLVSIVKLDNTIYECTIIATNVTNGSETYIDFEFYLADGGSQRLRFFLIVDKKLGNLEVLDQTDFTVQYDEDIIVYIGLKDYLSQNLSIIYVEVNSQITIFYNVETTTDFWFVYSTHGLIQGEHEINIYAESLYYYAKLEGNFTFEFTVTPLPLFIDIEVSNSTVLENTEFTITATLTFENGTEYGGQLLHFYVYSYSYENTSGEVLAAIPTNYTSYVIVNRTTNFQGVATIVFTMSEDIDYLLIAVTYDGGDFVDLSYSEMDEKVVKIIPSGFPSWLLYTLIGGSLFVILIISLIVYRVTRGKPFEEVMEDITVDDIMERYEELSPGVILTIFDQKKGPIPLIASHSLDSTRYLGRMQIGVENFLLKIADQAYSSLGFEEHDVGRRVGSIILPTEKMIGFVHGVQLPNKMARGGFENLSLIVLADSEYGNLLLNYQEFVYDEIDTIVDALKDKKQLKQVEEILRIVRHKSVKIMLTAEKIEEKKA